VTVTAAAACCAVEAETLCATTAWVVAGAWLGADFAGRTCLVAGALAAAFARAGVELGLVTGAIGAAATGKKPSSPIALRRAMLSL